MSDEENVDLRDFFELLRRRRRALLVTFAVSFALCSAAAVLWPATYRSTANVLIEDPDVTADLVRAPVSSSAAQRIEAIRQTVMTSSNLLRIAEEHDLYADERRDGETEKVLTKLRDRIEVETTDLETIDPASGRLGTVTIAFAVSFEYQDPWIAYKVAEQLAGLFMKENNESRTRRAKETFDFLSAEADLLRQEIAELERGLAAWGPTVSELGERVSDPASRLRELRSEQIRISAEFTHDHPEVSRMRDEIRALEKYVASSPPLERDYLALSREYEGALRRYDEVREQQTEARIRRDLELGRSEEFSLIDPARLPEEPIRPNRPLVLLLGLLLSLAIAGAGAALFEALRGAPSRAETPRSVESERPAERAYPRRVELE